MATPRSTNESLLTLLYRSKATVPFPLDALEGLVNGARDRNRDCEVTSGLFYERGRFFQWLEGPSASVEYLFETIGDDPRHDEIEVLSVGTASSRVFEDWSLRYFPDRQSIPDALHLAEPCRMCNAPECITTDVALDTARGDSVAFSGILQRAAGRVDIQVCYAERLLARYADLWARDVLSEAELVLGQVLALRDFRLAMATEPQPFVTRRDRILVTSLPGERDCLRTALATTMLNSAGYPAVFRLPTSLDQLVETFAKGRYDGLVLVADGAELSAEQLDAVDEISGLARYWSNTAIRIAVYGASTQLYDQRAGFAADTTCTTALHLPDFFEKERMRAH